MLASRYDYFDIAKILLQKGIDLNTKNILLIIMLFILIIWYSEIIYGDYQK